MIGLKINKAEKPKTNVVTKNAPPSVKPTKSKTNNVIPMQNTNAPEGIQEYTKDMPITFGYNVNCDYELWVKDFMLSGNVVAPIISCDFDDSRLVILDELINRIKKNSLDNKYIPLDITPEEPIVAVRPNKQSLKVEVV